jgi:hypothetical protein
VNILRPHGATCEIDGERQPCLCTLETLLRHLGQIWHPTDTPRPYRPLNFYARHPPLTKPPIGSSDVIKGMEKHVEVLWTVAPPELGNYAAWLFGYDPMGRRGI